MLGAPVEWDHERDGECGALAIREVGGVRFCESTWEPIEVERAQIAAMYHVILRIYGWRPVAVFVDRENSDES